MKTAIPYEVEEGWEKLPQGFTHRDVCGVAVDPQDRVYLLTRMDARILVYERDGSFVKAWGEGVFTERTHGIAIDRDGFIYTADDGDHTVRKFSPEGGQLMILGTPGRPSETGYSERGGLESIRRGGKPFNRPTGIAIGPKGDIYVCDGYGNARVHHFSPDGKLVCSWGEPGSGPGEFHLPHGISVSAEGLVYVADRENERIQIFGSEGEHLDSWNHVQRPTDVFVDGDGLVYVSSLWWRVGQNSYASGAIRFDLPGHISVLDSAGNLLLRWITADRCRPGGFAAPHTLCVDSHGDLYVGEVTYTYGVARGGVPEDCHTFQKLARTGNIPGFSYSSQDNTC